VLFAFTTTPDSQLKVLAWQIHNTTHKGTNTPSPQTHSLTQPQPQPQPQQEQCNTTTALTCHNTVCCTHRVASPLTSKQRPQHVTAQHTV